MMATDAGGGYPKSTRPPALSIVVPLYNSEATLPRLIEQLSSLVIDGGVEIVLVNDGSRDRTEAMAVELMQSSTMPITLLSLSRNFGEHNAVLEGMRASGGEFVVTMDDDLQNPPSEVLKLLAAARNENLDVVYSVYEEKHHPFWRNLGSVLTNWIADWSIDKPRGLYLSSFRCLSRFVADEIAKSRTPYPYIDGLIFQVTQNVGATRVLHAPRLAGESGYTLRRLLRLWLSMLINVSVLPLRFATFAGIGASVFGFISLLMVVIEHYSSGTPLGWGSLMAALLLFSGTQLLMLGVMGEYVGRSYLGVSGKPQSIVRRRLTSHSETPGDQPLQ